MTRTGPTGAEAAFMFALTPVPLELGTCPDLGGGLGGRVGGAVGRAADEGSATEVDAVSWPTGHRTEGKLLTLPDAELCWGQL